MQNLLKGLNSIDLSIVRRLEKLREDRRASENVPSDDELARRLAMLKGQDVDDLIPPKTCVSKKQIENERIIFQLYPKLILSQAHPTPDYRTQLQQSDDLLTQCKEEVEIDSKAPNPDDEIRERLNRLRSQVDTPPQVVCLLLSAVAVFISIVYFICFTTLCFSDLAY